MAKLYPGLTRVIPIKNKVKNITLQDAGLEFRRGHGMHTGLTMYIPLDFLKQIYFIKHALYLCCSLNMTTNEGFLLPH